MIFNIFFHLVFDVENGMEI